MLHRSFLNQLADYRFLAERLRNLNKRPKNTAARGQTSPAAANIVRYILEVSGAVSYFRLHKLFYMLEYHQFRNSGHRLTHSYVIRQKDGPYFVDLHVSKLRRALPDLEIYTKNDTLWLTLGGGDDLFKDGPTDNGLRAFVANIVRRYQARSDEELKTAVYLSSPMRTLLRKEEYSGANHFNAPIDFTPARQKSREVTKLARADK